MGPLSLVVAVELIALVVVAGVLFVVGTGITTVIASGMLVLAVLSCITAWVFVRRRREA